MGVQQTVEPVSVLVLMVLPLIADGASVLIGPRRRHTYRSDYTEPFGEHGWDEAATPAGRSATAGSRWDRTTR